jgi:hypothetical protein
MKLVKQLTKNDCMRACVASILEMKIEDVPDFFKPFFEKSSFTLEESKKAWHPVYKWCALKGYKLLLLNKYLRQNKYKDIEDKILPYVISCVPTSPHATHAIISKITRSGNAIEYIYCPSGSDLSKYQSPSGVYGFKIL